MMLEVAGKIIGFTLSTKFNDYGNVENKRNKKPLILRTCPTRCPISDNHYNNYYSKIRVIAKKLGLSRIDDPTNAYSSKQCVIR